ncbi:OmpA family protein [Dechloromonas sp.]|uniref:OmpA family protein n=1 Tax=Dechloromonas sp. TaxID=1917218 RepID=UPI00286E745A|nr:OmpA family protein [Dechloromonas sp.]
MTKVRMTLYFRAAILGLSLSIAFLSGCGTTSQPERPVQQVLKPPVPAEAKADSPPGITSGLSEKKAEPEIDEKTSVFFVFGSSTVGQSEKSKLRDAASRLKEDGDLSVTLIGRANDHGSRSVNLAVADARVEAVAAILRKLGVKAWQIKKNVIGGEKLSGNCVSTDCRRTMRRVELVFFEG